jgi:hypothetical protein
MRSTALVLALVTAISIQLTGQSGLCPNVPALGDSNFSERWLEGYIGNNPAKMYVASSGNTVLGVFYFTTDWTPIIFSGRYAEDGLIEASDKSDNAPATGHLSGKLSANVLIGSWLPAKTGKQSVVQMKSVPQPHCEIGNGKWRRFTSPQWPVSFSYPAGWRLERTRDGITITCPDPALMAYEGFHIEITPGTGHNSTKIEFTRCANTWYGPGCDCTDLDSVFCSQPVPVTRSKRMLLLNGDAGEWRAYCRDGGYAGQTEGSLRVLLFDNKWVKFSGEGSPSELIERIISTVRRR